VNALLLLMGLLVLSYIASFLMGGRGTRGVGLASGAEYVALGLALGPHALDLLGRSLVDSFEPIVEVALGWLTLVVGIDFGYSGERRVRPRSLALGLFSALLTGGLVACAVLVLLARYPVLPPGMDRWLLAGGVGAVCSETTRHAVRWVVERHEARGPLSELLEEVSHADDLVPLLALAILFAVTQKDAHLPWAVPAWGWILATIALGLVLGAVATLLLGREFHVHTTWGVLFGTSLLAIGTASRLGLSPLAVTFFMGMAMSAGSRHHAQIREIVGPTERPVLLPALLLAGARIDLGVLRTSRVLIGVIAIAVVGRLVTKIFSGAVMRLTSRGARAASFPVGLTLLSAGALSTGIGLAYAMRFPGMVGDTVLVTAVAAAILGEFVAPGALRRALEQAGEVESPPASERAATVEPR
jgi:hypothetical protein